MDNSILSFCAKTANVSALIAASILILAAVMLILFRHDIIYEKEPENGSKDKKGRDGEGGVYAEILRKNEIAANLFFAKTLLALTGVFILIAAGAEAGLFSVADKKVFGLVLACLISATATAALLTIGIEGKSTHAKRLLISAYVLGNFLVCILVSQIYCMLLLFPVIVSIRYCDGKFSAKTTAVCAAANLLSRPAAVAFGLYNGYYELAGVKAEPGTSITFSSSLIGTFFENGIVDTKYILTREISSVFFTTVLIVFAGICVSFIAKQGRKMIIDGAILTEKKNAAEREADEVRSRIMMSQLQPHFLYNSLSAIMAIDGNPPETMDALADFAKYLRGNLDSLTCRDLIPFAAEREHIERYLALEKLRFADRINVVYDIQTVDFLIPPLSVQMAVENAVKHGITQKSGGGTLLLKTEKTDTEVIVTVEDDGVGFDTSRDFSAEGNHVGLTSGVERIRRLTGGRTDITSVIGEGTKVVIHIPREKKS